MSDSSSCNSDVSHGLEANKNGPPGGPASNVTTTDVVDHVAVTTNKANSTIATPKVMEGSSWTHQRRIHNELLLSSE